MYCAYCSMMVALKKIEGNHPLIISAKEHLGLAVEYASRYHEKQWSIYWKTAKPSTKKALKQELQVLAFDTYTEFSEAIKFLNAFVDEMQRCQPVPPVPSWWADMLISLTLAHDAIVSEHEQEISSKQLDLFENL
jgi:hypothetical protein